MSPSTIPVSPTGTYTPGYARLKALMILFGLAILVAGYWQLEPPLRLLFFGERTRAEATYVTEIKAGLPDRLLRSDAQIQANLEPHDRSYVFWNEFSFHTTDGRVVNVRAPVGSQLQPLYPLLDEDGLPTTALVCYDAKHPETVVFPLIMSTWFVPGVMVFVGFLATLIGSVLLYWANKPIVLPHIPAASGKAEPEEKK